MSDSLENLIAKRFIARADVKAIQHKDGAYHPERNKITRADLLAHLSGDKTFGHYLLSKDSKCKFFCYDLDLKETGIWVDELDFVHEINPREVWADPSHPSRAWMTIQLRCLAEGLAARAMRVLSAGAAVSYSGNKGLHVYVFSDEAEDAKSIRAGAIHVLEDMGCFQRVRGDHFWEHTQTDDTTGYPNVSIEVFPKQDSLDNKDLGNLLRLPCGIHRKSGQSAFFLDLNTGLDTLKPRDPVHALSVLDPWAVS